MPIFLCVLQSKTGIVLLFLSFIDLKNESKNMGGHHATMGGQVSLGAVIRVCDVCRVCDRCRWVHRRQAAENRPELRQLQQSHQLRRDQLQQALAARAPLWRVAPANNMDLEKTEQEALYRCSMM
jgi:hypothetical protein